MRLDTHIVCACVEEWKTRRSTKIEMTNIRLEVYTKQHVKESLTSTPKP